MELVEEVLEIASASTSREKVQEVPISAKLTLQGSRRWRPMLALRFNQAILRQRIQRVMPMPIIITGRFKEKRPGGDRSKSIQKAVILICRKWQNL